ncbi:8-amino-7-oxononanoate synthase [Paracoccus sp. 1_MG-2023]|uniref:8-amino-7-oxononanoate synthase n=1 Tax=unclassified Paracoccus (in: a-proteobacteria) TaxID=2688777 RepID=UPI001C09141E|nr:MULTISPECIES: 8-amino-7-oxononanoate synthase [unclassified Paracoccus (in: a-proteobacteria)]MBU2956831.1 8-amino-7-oxononanoate synthase [Paracoccus sp. C2R09]MDO6670216.1 8-amino-7-oxononanoate synthase [Paracoccus sp. 1_MG-2023]
MDRLAVYRRDLDGLARLSRRRVLSDRRGIDFSSNDYIGLAQSQRLVAAARRALDAGVPVGAAGSRLLRGQTEAQARFEDAAARFFGAEAALGFGGGYVANFAVLTTLPQRGDLLLMDELSHASTHEGARAGRAGVATFRHGDVGHAADVIAGWRAQGNTGAVWIAVESLYSMDGDRAPLDDLMALADEHGFLMVDEAHATGVYGQQGRGLAHHLEGRDNVVTLHTLGKALGGSGALICASRVLIDFLVNRCRPFIFATAPSPLMAAVGLESLAILRDEPWRQAVLQGHIDCFGAEIARRLPHLQVSGSQIVPLIVGQNAPTMELAAAMQARGFDIRGIRPPTVPEGTSRLRISLTLNAGRADVIRLAELLEELWPDT